MKVEITKLTIIRVAIGIVILVAIFCCGYFIGYDNGVECMKNPKGDGEHFYSEIQDASGINDHIYKYHKVLYHSTLECPNIRTGVEMDGFGYVESLTNGQIPYYFCPTCMNNELIRECEKRIIRASETDNNY